MQVILGRGEGLFFREVPAMQEDGLLLNASWVDYTLVAIYFLFVLGIGWAAKSKVSSSIDFFLSGRSLPAWVTGLAFISAACPPTVCSTASKPCTTSGSAPSRRWYSWVLS